MRGRQLRLSEKGNTSFGVVECDHKGGHEIPADNTSPAFHLPALAPDRELRRRPS